MVVLTGAVVMLLAAAVGVGVALGGTGGTGGTVDKSGTGTAAASGGAGQRASAIGIAAGAGGPAEVGGQAGPSGGGTGGGSGAGRAGGGTTKTTSPTTTSDSTTTTTTTGATTTTEPFQVAVRGESGSTCKADPSGGGYTYVAYFRGLITHHGVGRLRYQWGRGAADVKGPVITVVITSGQGGTYQQEDDITGHAASATSTVTDRLYFLEPPIGATLVMTAKVC